MKHLEMILFLLSTLLMLFCEEKQQPVYNSSRLQTPYGLTTASPAISADGYLPRINPSTPDPASPTTLNPGLFSLSETTRRASRLRSDSIFRRALYNQSFQQNLAAYNYSQQQQQWAAAVQNFQNKEVPRLLHQTGNSAFQSAYRTAQPYFTNTAQDAYRSTRPYLNEALATTSRNHRLLWQNLGQDARTVGQIWKTAPIVQQENVWIQKAWQFTQKAATQVRANPGRYLTKIRIR